VKKLLDKLKLKVCGMRNTDNILQVALSVKPDYMGFIFYKKSPRYVGEEFVMPSISADVRKVALTVNMPTDEIIARVEKYTFEYVQFHGDETPKEVELVKKRGISTIKVFHLDEKFDFTSLLPFEPHVDYFLFDTPTVKYGGSGKTFNWQLLQNYKMEIPFFLSGGLNPDNLKDVENIDHPQLFGLDVNSGFETAPGLKDVKKLIELRS